MGKLDSKVALVTGAARGMGAATATRLAQEGARVVLTDVLDTEGAAKAKAIGSQALYLHQDVSRPGDWSRVIQQVEQAFGPVDILVNNAAIAGPVKPLEELSDEEFERMLDINLKSVFYGMRAVFPAMKQRKRGAIINFSSVAGLMGAAQMIGYTASKFAVRGMTKSAALEGAAFGIRVNSIHPGYIDTEMVANQIPADPAAAEAFKRAVSPLQRMGRPEEVAAMVLFLASEEGSFATGAEFTIDGGFMAG